ncbi:hypothetical protein [Peterkaempfera bronchialis]|uniref:Uncharacterized protein n=1 Tax=Peterkaempfera bronchialis TaxID=2126346 RepID=A0A345SSZ6_9ACTN|nr:hypothetical protein [Peterkaempfera bronchialis]AXI76851.1 hypothetical protein C7M71_004635 [Peterkaempfera bronchialis]
MPSPLGRADRAAETALLPPVTDPARAAAPRGRILVVEGGFAASGRWPWSRQAVASGAPALSAVLAAVSPQVLLAADAVDAVHLPSATDPQTVLAHLRAAARHPGPVLIHLAGHVIADRRGGRLHLALRDSKPSSVRHDGLPWPWIAAELRARPAEWGALVIADLSADEMVWPQLHTVPSPLAEGLPLWAAVSPNPDHVGIFTRALVEALHSGQPGAGAALSPEQLQHQVQSVLRPDVLLVASHGPGQPVFRNTARRAEPAATTTTTTVTTTAMSAMPPRAATATGSTALRALPPRPRPRRPRAALHSRPGPGPRARAALRPALRSRLRPVLGPDPRARAALRARAGPRLRPGLGLRPGPRLRPGPGPRLDPRPHQAAGLA